MSGAEGDRDNDWRPGCLSPTSARRFEIDNPSLVDSAQLCEFRMDRQVELPITEFRSDASVAAFDRSAGDNREITLAYVVRRGDARHIRPSPRAWRTCTAAILGAHGDGTHGVQEPVGRRMMFSRRKSNRKGHCGSSPRDPSRRGRAIVPYPSS